MSSQRPIPTVDRISALPDSLICHILSFLPTKLAVATSVLSKRWTPLWRSVLTLDFEVDRFEDFSIFRNFVYSVINSREVTLPLRSFRIKCGDSINFNPFHVNHFVHAAVQRQIENFDLDLSGVALGDMEKLTPSVFSVLSCRTLVVLKLKNLILYHAPQLIDLPVLKTLNLDVVIFVGSSAHFNILVHGCPILEEFHTQWVLVEQYDENDEFNGFPCLLRANLYVYEQNLPLLWFHNAKFLHAELWNTYEYGVPTFPNLTHMELVFHSRDYNLKWGWVIEVLQNCPKLQNLTIDQAGEFRDKFENKDWEDLETVPECLSSRLRTCSLGGFSGHPRELQFAEYIMMNSKLLSTMTIKSSCLVDGNEKHQLLVKLSSYPWGSPTCKLLFD